MRAEVDARPDIVGRASIHQEHQGHVSAGAGLLPAANDLGATRMGRVDVDDGHVDGETDCQLEGVLGVRGLYHPESVVDEGLADCPA